MHKNSIIKSSGYLILDQAINSALSVAFTMYLARSLGKEDMATYALFFIIGNVLKLVGNLGLPTYAIREIPFLISSGRAERAKGILGKSIVLINLMNMAICFVIILNSSVVSRLLLKNASRGSDVRLIIIACFFAVSYEMSKLFFHSLQQFKAIGILNIIYGFFWRGMTLGLYLLAGFRGLLVGISVSNIAASLSLLYFLRYHLFLFDKGCQIGELLHKSLFYYLRGFSRYGLSGLDQLIVGVFFSPSILASYFIATKIATYLVVLFDNIVKPIVPKFSEIKSRGSEVQTAFAKKVLRLSTIAFLPIAVSAAAISPSLLRIVGGEKYIDAGWVLAILFLATFSMALSDILGGLILIVKKGLTYFTQQNFGAIINIALFIPLGKLLGVEGIALAYLIASWATVVFSIAILREVVRFPYKELGYVSAGSFLIGTLIFFIQMVFPSEFLSPLYALLVLSFYGGVCLLFMKDLRNEILSINIFRKVHTG